NSAFKEIVLGMVRMGNFDAALKVAEKIEEDAYNRAFAFKEIALGMLKAGMFEKALETIDAALKVAEKIEDRYKRR
ncbi:MAG: hypothetical protein B6U95_02355, partial [Thermofilum sp. ex4484_82]